MLGYITLSIVVFTKQHIIIWETKTKKQNKKDESKTKGKVILTLTALKVFLSGVIFEIL
jgi:hypothetical protein